MKLSELKEFDASEHLKSEEHIRAYLAEMFKDGDPRMIQAALGDVAKARGMTALARDMGVQRAALYRALSETGNAEFATIMKVMRGLGLYLSVEVAGPVAKKSKTASKARPAAKKAAKPEHADI